MNHRSVLATSVLGLCLALPWSVSAGALTIRDLAPAGASFVAGVDDVPALRASFDRTGFRALWDEPDVQHWLGEMTDDLMPQLTKNMEGVGIDIKDLSWPTGGAGLALWPDAERPTEDGVILMFADFGDRAKAMNDMIVEALERGSDQGLIELDRDEEGDATVWTIRPIQGDDADFEDMEAGGALDQVFDRVEAGAPFDEMRYARSGEYLLMSSDADTLTDALERIGGRDAPSIDDNPSFRAALQKVGGPTGAYAVFVAQSMWDALTKAAEDDGGGELGPAVKMISSLGLNSIKAAAAGLHFDSDDAMAEGRMAVLTEGKPGLLGLLDVPATPFTPPAFVGADAAGFSVMQFNFAGVVPLVNQVISTLPPEQQAQMQGMAGMFLGVLQPMLANIGPQVFVSAHYQQPFSATSQQQIWAIAVRDEEAVVQSLSGIFPMFGFEQRDFQGNRIWSPGPGAMVPSGAVAIGMGFGSMFVGPTASVENAMRQAGAGANGGARLADEPRFQRASRSVADRAIMYAWADTRKTFEWADWYVRHLDEVVAQQMAAQGQDGAFDQMDPDEKGSMEDFFKDLPALDLLPRHLGDTVFDVRSTPDGFEGRMMWLRPSK